MSDLSSTWILSIQADSGGYSAFSGLAKIAGLAVGVLLASLAGAIYQKFPAKRKAICVCCITNGFICLVAGALIANIVGFSRMNDALGSVMIALLFLGMGSASLGYYLLRRLNAG